MAALGRLDRAHEVKPWYQRAALLGIGAMCAYSYMQDKVPTVATAILLAGPTYCAPSCFVPKLTGKKMSLLTCAGLGASYVMMPWPARCVAAGIVSVLVAREVMSDLQRAILGFG